MEKNLRFACDKNVPFRTKRYTYEDLKNSEHKLYLKNKNYTNLLFLLMSLVEYVRFGAQHPRYAYEGEDDKEIVQLVLTGEQQHLLVLLMREHEHVDQTNQKARRRLFTVLIGC